MIPWFERPTIYDVRARPHLVESTSGSRDLQMVKFPVLYCCFECSKKYKVQAFVYNCEDLEFPLKF